MKQLKLILTVLLFVVSILSLSAQTAYFVNCTTAADYEVEEGDTAQVVFIANWGASSYTSLTSYSDWSILRTNSSNTDGASVTYFEFYSSTLAEMGRTTVTMNGVTKQAMNYSLNYSSYPNHKYDLFYITGRTSTIRDYYGRYMGYVNGNATMYFYNPAGSNSSRITEYTFPLSVSGNIRMSPYSGVSYSYWYGYANFQYNSSASYYGVFRRAYSCPNITFKEENGLDHSDIAKLISIGASSGFSFKELKGLPTAVLNSNDYAEYIDIKGWYDTDGNLLGQPGDNFTTPTDNTIVLHYELIKFPLKVTPAVTFELDAMDKYATLQGNKTVYSVANKLTLPNVVLKDSRYNGHIILKGWANSIGGSIVGKPGDLLEGITSTRTLYAVYDSIPYKFTFDGRFYANPSKTEDEQCYQLTLPTLSWKQTSYSTTLDILGWYDSNGTKIGAPGETIKVYADMNLHAMYGALGGPANTWFKRVTKQSDLTLASGETSMDIIIINNGSETAIVSYYTKDYTSGTYVNTQSTYYTNANNSATAAWSTARAQTEFKIDLTPVTNSGSSNTYDNNRFVWTITSDSNTLVKGFAGYWAGNYGNFNSTSNSYSLYTFPYSSTSSLRYFNFWVNGTTGTESKIEWTQYTNASYRMLYYYSTSYQKFSSNTASNSTYTIYRRGYRVALALDDELADYGSLSQISLYTTNTITLPDINFGRAEYGTYITDRQWVDENGIVVGKPGDVITVTRNMDIHMTYTIKKFKVTFDAGDYGTCATTEVMALLPFTLPNVAVQSGYYFEGWASTINDRIVGRGGEKYPKSANTLTYDDDLYAVYTQSFDVLEWGENSLTLEFLNAAATAETQTSNGTKKINNLTDCEVDKGIYRLLVNNGDLANDFGQTLTIVFKDAQGVVVSQATTIIPAIVTSSVKIEDEYDRMLAATTDLIVTNGGVATAGNTNFAFQNVKVQGGGKLVIPSGASLTAGKVSLCVGAIENGAYQFVYPQLVANGSLTNANGDTIVVEYLLNEDQYYTLCLPYNVKVSEVTYPTGAKVVLNKNLWVAVYDGAKRATSVKGSLTSGWVDFSGTQFTAGTGYTIAATPRTVRITGGSTVQRKYALINMPMKANLTSGETTSNKTTPVSPYPTSTGGDNDAGWNLVGDPYLADYGGNVDGLVNNNGIGLLVDDGAGGYDWQGKVRYVVMPNNNGTAYNPVVATATSLPAFKNFFVQIGTGDALTFLLSNRAQKKPAYFAQFEEDEYAEDIMTGIKVTHGDMVDKVGVVIGDNYTTDYEINGDLQKWTNYLDARRTVEALNLYAIGADDQLAFIALNENDAKNVKLGIHMPEMGGYTFSIDDEYDTSDLEAVNLTYTAQGKAPVTTNLLEKTYRINAGMATTYTDRLTLSVVKKQNTPTGIDALETNVDNVDKVIVDGALYIINNGKVYDAQGVLVK